MITTPARTGEQRLQALTLANETRTRRARLKRRIAAGEIAIRDVILDPPEWALSMRVLDVLMAAPRVGPVKASSALNRARASHSKTLGGLSERQRFDVLANLPRPAVNVAIRPARRPPELDQFLDGRRAAA